MNSIYKMELHEIMSVGTNSKDGSSPVFYGVVRVPGGWLYKEWNTEIQEYTGETFVPFDNGFMGKETTE